MKKLGLILVWLLSLATLSIFFLGASMVAQDDSPLLLFTSYNSETETSELYLINPETGEERLITNLSPSSDAGWSPDGRIWLVEDDGTERRLTYFDAMTGEESAGIEGIYPDPCFPSVYWSPNGEQLAYISKEGEDFFMNIQNLYGNTSYQLGIEHARSPLWSPDSRYLYLGFRHSSTAEPFLSAAGGSLMSEISGFIDFSPDSRYISYQGERQSLYLYEIATGENIELAASYYGYWSPSGRYFLLDTSLYAEALLLSYYDTQNQSFHNIDLGFTDDFAAWTSDESVVLLYANFADYAGELRPTKLLSYELASGDTETILDLEDEGWLGGVYRSGDWLAIRYSLTPPEDHFSPTTHMLFLNGETRHDVELLVDDGWRRLSVTSLPEGGFLIDAVDGLYHFDSETASLETITTENNSYPFLSADGAYIAFVSVNMPDKPNTLNIWSMESRSISLLLEEEGHPTIIGWQGSPIRESLLYCGEG